MKRFLSALLCGALVCALLPGALGAQAIPAQEEVAQVLSALDIMTGDAAGNLNLDATVSRAEFVKLTVAASAGHSAVGPTASVSPYPDVPRSHWAAPWVQAAKEENLVRGYLDGSFRPQGTLSLAEGVTMALRLLGYQDADFSGAYPAGQMALYRTLKLDGGIVAGETEPMTRRDAMYLFYHLLTASTKTGQVYLSVLKPTEKLLTATGEIDRVALLNSAMEGPLVVGPGWTDGVPFPVSTAKVYRGGGKSTLSALQPNDVVYFSAPMRTLWAWADGVTGTYEKATPSSAAPTAIVVAGKSYAIETAAAAFALSDLGEYQVGQQVNLLLGRTGAVAAVTRPGETPSVRVGLVTTVAPAAYVDKDGNRYTATAVEVLATDGKQYRYQWDKKLEVGDLVQIIPQKDGFSLVPCPATPLSGLVNGAGTAIGTTALAEQVEILDTCGKTAAIRVYPGRLAGVKLQDDMVRYYSTNPQGEIDRLILKDATGDAHQYGVLTKVDEISMGMLVGGTYAYDVGGTAGVVSSSTAVYGVQKGPCQIEMEGSKLRGVSNLSKLPLTGVDGATALTANGQRTLSETVAVYEVRDEAYYSTDLNRVKGGGYTLTGYYDKAEREGGRIRVILATPVK